MSSPKKEKRLKDFVIKVGVCKKDEREAPFAAGDYSRRV